MRGSGVAVRHNTTDCTENRRPGLKSRPTEVTHVFHWRDVSLVICERETFRRVYKAAGGDECSACVEVEDRACRGELAFIAEGDHIGDFCDGSEGSVGVVAEEPVGGAVAVVAGGAPNAFADAARCGGVGGLDDRTVLTKLLEGTNGADESSGLTIGDCDGYVPNALEGCCPPVPAGPSGKPRRLMCENCADLEESRFHVDLLLGL